MIKSVQDPDHLSWHQKKIQAAVVPPFAILTRHGLLCCFADRALLLDEKTNIVSTRTNHSACYCNGYHCFVIFVGCIEESLMSNRAVI